MDERSFIYVSGYISDCAVFFFTYKMGSDRRKQAMTSDLRLNRKLHAPAALPQSSPPWPLGGVAERSDSFQRHLILFSFFPFHCDVLTSCDASSVTHGLHKQEV